MKASWSENSKFSVANTVLILYVSKLTLEVLRPRNFLAAASKRECDMTIMTK